MSPALQAALIVVGAVAGACWLGAFVSWLRMLANLSGRRTLGSMLFHGMAAFDPQNFTDAGRRWQRRFVRFFLGFFAAAVALVLLAALTARP